MNWPGHELLLTLLSAAICMFCAMLTSAVLTLPAANRPLPHILGTVLPVLIASLALLRQGGVEPAITLLTASATTLAIFVNGAIVLITPRHDHQPPPAQSPAAALVLPLALVLILAGFSSHLTLATSIGLAVLGTLCIDLARSLAPFPAPAPTTAPSTSSKLAWPLCILIAAFPLTLLYFVTGQFWHSGQTAHLISARDLAIVNLLCPALLLSLLRKSLAVSHDHSPADALSMSGSCIGIILGLALPGICLLDYLIRRQTNEFAMVTGLPQLSWRLDAPLLVAGGFTLVAMRLDIVRPSRLVGLLLIVLYVAYLLTGSVLRLL